MDYEVTIATGPTSALTEEAREEYEQLLELLRQDKIDGRIAERELRGRGVTWIEVTEIWLAVKGAEAITSWAFEKALDKVATRAKQWVKIKRRKSHEQGDRKTVRPQSIIIKSLSGEPERRIDVDSKGNVTEYRWVKIDGSQSAEDTSD
jgi:hypothetical protein